MRNRVERLRLWLLAGAGLLVVVLGVFIGSARYLMHHFLARLPAKLGVNIKSETNGFTYSQSLQGKTVYTIHAAKEVEHTDGKITLHNVHMVLYGRKGDRADEIKGDEFEYDQGAGLVRAIGLVHIDLKAAETDVSDRPAKAAGRVRKDGGDDKILHATTSGLIYMEKLGVAATGEAIEFELGGMKGHAVGADYNTDSGLLILHSAVDMSGTAGKRPVALTAASAELDNRDQTAFLTRAKYVSLDETVQAEQATLHTRPDGTLARIEAQGNVTSETKSGRMVSQRADILLNEESQPQSALFTGGVAYTLDEPLQQRKAQSDALTVAYDAEGRPEHAVFSGSVRLMERTRATEAAKEPWSVRELTAAKVDDDLVAVDAHRSELRDAEATGSAHLTMVNNGSLASAKGEGLTELFGDDLKVHLTRTGDAAQRPQLDTIAGRGRTLLRRVSAEGIEQTSAGDTLDGKFRPGVQDARPAGTADRAGRSASDTLLSAVQQGHVTIMRRVPAKASAKANALDDVEHATAARAAYDGDLDRVMLTGGVQLTDSGSVVWANQVGLDHKTGDAQAEGAVKVNYVQASSAGGALPQTASHSLGAAGGLKSEPEPAHILADRADLKHATQVATFYGKPARMWQGASQVQAPVLEFARAERRLIGRGEANAVGQVHTVLVKGGGGKAAPDKPAALGKTGASKIALVGHGGAGVSQTVRITSREVMYSETTHQAEFTGGVRLESSDGTMGAREATVYLKPTGALQSAKTEAESAVATSGLTLDGPVERVIASGHIEIEQPGRRATGELLVYTASDQLYVLTGDKDVQPKVVDTLRGSTVTGAAIQFHAGDESVEALSATGERVRTETTVNAEKKAGSAKR